MYASRTTQLIVGIFALIGIAALAFLSVRLGRVEIFPPPSYMLFANFDNVAGLKSGDDVQIAGVNVGKVQSISLMRQSDRARVALRIDDGVKVDSDAIAAIRTRGIIGDKYVAISPGGGTNLSPGATIRQTESSFVLENAIGQLISNFSTGGGSKSSGKSNGKNSGGLPSLDAPGAGSH